MSSECGCQFRATRKQTPRESEKCKQFIEGNIYEMCRGEEMPSDQDAELTVVNEEEKEGLARKLHRYHHQ